MADEADSRTDDEKVLDRARKRWAQASEAEDDNRRKEADDIKFAAASPDDNFQWPQDVLLARQDKTQEGGPRPCLTINPLPTHIRQVTNEQRMNRPQIKVRPADDMGDPKVAKVYDGLFRHIQVASEADLAYDTACDWQVAGGEGFFRILTEYCDELSFDQDIVIAPIADRFKVYLDPIGLLHHPAGKKCKWGFIVEDVPKDDYEAEFGEKHPIDWKEAGTGDMVDWFPGKDTVRIAEYFEIEEKDATLLLWSNGQTSIKGEPLPQGIPAVEKPKKERATRTPVCVWRKLNGQHVLKKTEMPTKYIPIVRVIGNQYIVDGKPIVSGLTRNSKDAVRMYNYNASMEVELNSLAPRAPITAMMEQIKGHEDKYRNANRVNYGVLPYNAVYNEDGSLANVSPPQRMVAAMPQAAIISAKLAAADDIKKTTGQFDPSLGNNPQAKSGIALQREQVKSEVGTFHYVDNLARALRYAGAIMLDMAPKVYTGKRVLRILGEDGEPDHVLLDPSINGAVAEVAGDDGETSEAYRLDYGKYDLVVTTGPSFTTKRQEASEFLTNAIQAAKDPVMAQVLTYLALKSNDWAGAEEATDMVKKLLPPGILPPEGKEEQEPMVPTPQGPLPIPGAAQLIGQLMGQVEQMNGAVQQMQGEAKQVEQGKADIARGLDQMKAKEESMALRERLVLKTMEAEQAQDQAAKTKIIADIEKTVMQAVNRLEAMKVDVAQSKAGEDEVARMQENAKAAARNAEVTAMQEQLLAQLAQTLQALAAPRRIDLVTDAAGMPVGAVSAPAPIEGMTV